jgi:translation initiation factor 3 subunit H
LQAQAGSRYVARDLAQNIKDREDWLLARRRENELRCSQGLEPLPEVDSTLPFFKPVVDKAGRDALDTLLLSAQISAHCGSIRRFAEQGFGKLFLAGELVKGKREGEA